MAALTHNPIAPIADAINRAIAAVSKGRTMSLARIAGSGDFGLARNLIDARRHRGTTTGATSVRVKIMFISPKTISANETPTHPVLADLQRFAKPKTGSYEDAMSRQLPILLLEKEPNSAGIDQPIINIGRPAAMPRHTILPGMANGTAVMSSIPGGMRLSAPPIPANLVPAYQMTLRQGNTVKPCISGGTLRGISPKSGYYQRS